MKAILILCLLATLNCNFIDTAFCLIGNEKIQNTFTEVVSAIKEKDFNEILKIVISNLPDIIDIVGDCVKPEKKDNEGEVVLEKKRGNGSGSTGNVIGIGTKKGGNKPVVVPLVAYPRKTIIVHPSKQKPKIV